MKTTDTMADGVEDVLDGIGVLTSVVGTPDMQKVPKSDLTAIIDIVQHSASRLQDISVKLTAHRETAPDSPPEEADEAR